MRKLIFLSVVVLLLAACAPAVDTVALQTALADANEANQQWATEYAGLANELDHMRDSLSTANAPTDEPVVTETVGLTQSPTGVIQCANTDQAIRLSFGYVIGAGKPSERISFSVGEDCYTVIFGFPDSGFVAVRASVDGESFSTCTYVDGAGESHICTLTYTREFSAPNLNASGYADDFVLCFAENQYSYNGFSGCGK